MDRAIKAAAALPVLVYGWLVAASAGYLALNDKLDLFRFPFLQWVQAAPWWRLNWRMTATVCGSAALPTLVLLLCAFGMIRHWWRNRGRADVYGKTNWATPQQMNGGGLRLRDRL